MDIQHGGSAIPDATPTGGPGTTLLDIHDGTGISWTMTRVAGHVVAIPAVSVVGIPASGATGQVVGYGGSPGTGAWVAPPGTEIGYDQITAQVNVTGTSAGAPTTVIGGSAHTFDGAPVMMEFYSYTVQPPTVAGDFIAFGLYEGTTLIAFCEVQTPVAAAMWVPAYFTLRFTPTSGSHTYSIKSWVTIATGTPFVGAGSGSGSTPAPAFLRFTKV